MSEKVETPQRVSVTRQIIESSGLITFLAIFAALVLSSLLVVGADDASRAALGYLFSKPGDFFAAGWDAVSSTYYSLFRGSIFDPQASSTVRMFRPITETMLAATPLLFAGLGLGIAFRSGLFNIGAQGQVLVGAGASAYVGFALDMPMGIHLILAILAGGLMGAFWAAIAGFLKARVGANEVIVTIMLNWVATYFMAYLLTTQLMRRGGNQPIAPNVHGSAMYPTLMEAPIRLHWGFVLGLAATFGVWWLMERSTLGFRFRAVGANMDAARTAGINVNRMFVLVMAIAGFLAGLGGTTQVLIPNQPFQGSSAGSIGFDAITVALLGRSRPVGTLFAALLFGALRAGAPAMQTLANTPPDLVTVLQAMIVLFIAAPPLVRSIFFLPEPGKLRRAKEVAV